MSKSSKEKQLKQYRKEAQELKKLGLLNFPIPRAGKEHHLTSSQKATITRQYNKNKPIIKNPQDYEKRSVSKKTARLLDSSPLTVSTAKRATVFIPKEKNQEIKILKGGIVRKRKGDYEIKVYPAGWNTLKTADKLFAKKLKRNEYITAQIGDNAHFQKTFRNKTEMLNYLRNWQPKDPKTKKSDLITRFALVRVRNDPDSVFTQGWNEDDAEDYEDFEDDE